MCYRAILICLLGKFKDKENEIIHIKITKEYGTGMEPSGLRWASRWRPGGIVKKKKE